MDVKSVVKSPEKHRRRLSMTFWCPTCSKIRLASQLGELKISSRRGWICMECKGVAQRMYLNYEP